MKKHLLKHPFYQAWSAGKLSLEDLRTYACQYYHHVEAFPNYIRATINNCHSIHTKQILTDNLNDEEGINGVKVTRSYGYNLQKVWVYVKKQSKIVYCFQKLKIH